MTSRPPSELTINLYSDYDNKAKPGGQIKKPKSASYVNEDGSLDDDDDYDDEDQDESICNPCSCCACCSLQAHCIFIALFEIIIGIPYMVVTYYIFAVANAFFREKSNFRQILTEDGLSRDFVNLIGPDTITKAESYYNSYKYLQLFAGFSCTGAGIILLVSITCKGASNLMAAIGCWINAGLILFHLLMQNAALAVFIVMINTVTNVLEFMFGPDSGYGFGRSGDQNQTNINSRQMFTLDFADIEKHVRTIFIVYIIVAVLQILLFSYFAFCSFALGSKIIAGISESTSDEDDDDDDD